MDLQYLIHKNTLGSIEGYLSMADPPGLILSGISGLGKKELGMHIASRLLSTTEKDLKKNPDFYMAGQEQDINAEEVGRIFEFSLRSCIRNKKVILINRAHTITVPTQNKLLKTLEDRPDNILIFLADSNTLIPTVRSRCCTICLRPLSDEAMTDFLKMQGVSACDAGFISYLTGNAPYLYLREQELLEGYKEQYRLLCQIQEKPDLLKAMHALKEKDRENFYEVNSSRPVWNIKLVTYPFYAYCISTINNAGIDKSIYPANLYTPTEAYKIMRMGQHHLKKKNYTKNDYFNLLRNIVNFTEEGGPYATYNL